MLATLILTVSECCVINVVLQHFRIQAVVADFVAAGTLSVSDAQSAEFWHRLKLGQLCQM